MKVTFAPDGGAVQSWTYEPRKVRQSEAEMMEKRAGLSWDEFNGQLLKGAARPRKVLLWHCLRKDHPVLRWEDVPDFAMAEVTVEFDASELAEVRALVEKSKDASDEDKAALLEVLDAQIADAGESDPKAPPSPSSGPATGV